MDTMNAAAPLPIEAPGGLEGVWAKLRRATDHIHELDREVAAYLARPPYRVIRAVEGDWETVSAQVWFEPPLKLATVFGDVLHCCTSALDQLAWAFALTTTNRPHDRTQFPNYERQRDFERETRLGGRLADIPADVLRIMEDLQPFQPADTVGGLIGRELLTIRRLSNEDKHRLLPVVNIFVAPQAVAYPGGESPIEWLTAGDGTLNGYRVPRDLSSRLRLQEWWEANVTIARDGLPWRSGLVASAKHVYNEATFPIGALRPHWRLLAS